MEGLHKYERLKLEALLFLVYSLEKILDYDLGFWLLN